MNYSNQTVIENNRKTFQMMGSTLGTGIFQVESRSCDADYERRKLEATQGGNIDLFLNREIKRIRIVSHNVVKVGIDEDAQGAAYVGIETDSNKKISLPIAADFSHVGDVTTDALRNAIKGDNNIIFNNPDKLVESVNQINRNEITRLEGVRKNIDAIISSLKNTITENEKKANDYQKQLLESTPDPDFTKRGSSVTIEATMENC